MDGTTNGNGFHPSKHNPNGSTRFFDETRIANMITSWQVSHDTRELGQILNLCRPSILSLIHSQDTTKYEAEDELVARVNLKLLKSLHRWDPTRGSAFSFTRWVTQNSLIRSVNESRKQAARYTPMEPTLLNALPVHTADESPTEFLEVIRHATSQIRSSVTDPAEREAQKWMLQSLSDVEFSLARHQVADVGKEFGLTHARSRMLYDLTLLGLRRILYDELGKRTTHISLRDRAMLRFDPFLKPREMTKLFCLLRNLGFVAIVKHHRPQNSLAIDQLDNYQKVRESLLLVLNGDPSSTPLYPA